MQTIGDAIVFATRAHAGGIRKGNLLPYIVHPIEVLKLIGDWDILDSAIRMAAVCHDVKEENPTLAVELPKVIGENASRVVEELTFYPDQQTKEEYMNSFDRKSVSALIIKIADRTCNTNDFRRAAKIDSQNYAKTYWGKAKNLIQTFNNRRAEVIKEIGLFSTNRIEATILEVETAVSSATSWHVQPAW